MTLNYQWTYDPAKEKDYSALLVNKGDYVVGMITGEMAEAINHLLNNAYTLTAIDEIKVANLVQIQANCEVNHRYALKDGKCPECAKNYWDKIAELSIVIGALKIYIQNLDINRTTAEHLMQLRGNYMPPILRALENLK